MSAKSEEPESSQESEGLQLLVEIAAELRPRKGARDPVANLEAATRRLAADSDKRLRFSAAARDLLSRRRLVHALSRGGILSNRGFFGGLKRILSERLLLRILPSSDVRRAIPMIFARNEDYRWLNRLPAKKLAEFLELILTEDDARGIPHPDLAIALRALAGRIGALAMDEELETRLKAVDAGGSPFLQLSVRAHFFIEDHRRGLGGEESYKQVDTVLRDCRSQVDALRRDKHVEGVSLHLTGVIRRLLQNLERFRLLLNIIRPDNPADFARSVAPLLQGVVEAEQTRTHLSRYIRQRLDLIAYKITEHTADKGDLFAARTPGEYWNFFVASLAGGAFVAAFALFKLMFAKLDLPLAAQALLYGLNYSACFVLIYVSGAILATKMPATTASSIARLFDETPESRAALPGVVAEIVVVWRSQFVAFAGNLLCAFPAAMLLAYALESLGGIQVADAEKSRELLRSNHPLLSGALVYACVAGVFLFVAGVVQGAVENRVRYTRLENKLRRHPLFFILGRRRTSAARFVAKYASGIVGNIVLGFLLGSAGTLGVIFGLPFDIRHIAFSSAHVGVASIGVPGAAAFSDPVFYVVLVGVLGIGILNFLVSFGLTLSVTLRSRNVTIDQGGKLVLLLIWHFLRRPLHWFLPLRLPEENRVSDES
ncbi:MAG: site-specific recombinase [bacterium]|nr:site-specific recombinase [bacterium]